MDHPPPPEQRKDKYLSKQGGCGMHLDGVQGIEELDAIKLEHQFSQDLFSQEGGLFAIVEEDDPEEAIVLVAGYLSHEELEVVDVEFAIKEFFLAWRVLPPRYFAHVFLTAHFAPGPVIVTIVFQNDLVILAEAGGFEDLFEGEMFIIVFEVFDF